MSAGSYFLTRKSRPAAMIAAGWDRFQADWYLYVRFPGRDPTTVATGFPICAACLQADKPGQEREHCKCQQKPRQIGTRRLAELNDERWGLGAAAPVPRARRQWATLGEVFAAFLAWHQAREKDTKKLKTARRAVNDMRLVVAYANDFWELTTKKGVKAGSKVPAVGKIDSLAVSACDVAFLRRYFAARQGGEWDPTSRESGNLSINSTLKNAKVLFSKNSRSFILESLKIPWEDLEKFLQHPLLLTPASTPEMVDGDHWEAMAAAAEARGDELGLINWILRTTGLRTIELLALRPSWLMEMGGRTWLDIRDRASEGFLIKGGTTAGLVPLRPDLAAVLRARAAKSPTWLVGDGLTADARDKLCSKQHNAFVKGFLGGLGQRTQGNHRLRDFVGQFVYTLYGETRARDALRHADAKTTLAFYARYRPTVPERARRELAAWEGGRK